MELHKSMRKSLKGIKQECTQEKFAKNWEIMRAKYSKQMSGTVSKKVPLNQEGKSASMQESIQGRQGSMQTNKERTTDKICAKVAKIYQKLRKKPTRNQARKFASDIKNNQGKSKQDSWGGNRTKSTKKATNQAEKYAINQQEPGVNLRKKRSKGLARNHAKDLAKKQRKA